MRSSTTGIVTAGSPARVVVLNPNGSFTYTPPSASFTGFVSFTYKAYDGLAPSANLDPSRRHPSMFEPVHGSAPDIFGRGIANPIAAVWSAAMMLDHLGQPAAAAAITDAIAAVTSRGAALTPDLGGSATTAQLGDAIVAALPGR